MASVILWTVALPLISLYSNQSILGYGDNDVTTLTEANLFFSTWFCLFYSFLLATSWRNASVTTTDWVLMSIVSFALLGSSVTFLRKYNGESFVSGLHSCDGICGTRVTFGFYLGLSSGLISLVLILLYRLGPCFHLVFGVASICVWAVGVGYITFAPSSVSEHRVERTEKDRNRPSHTNYHFFFILDNNLITRDTEHRPEQYTSPVGAHCLHR